MDKASEAIFALKPVTFRYKKERDAEGTPQFGLIAEEVADVNPDLVVRDEGEIYTVRYEQSTRCCSTSSSKSTARWRNWKRRSLNNKRSFNVRRGTAATNATLTARLEEQASQIQKVSAQLEMSKPAPQTVLNNQ